jgi:hypothetical protein
MYNPTEIRESFRRGRVLAPVASRSAGILTASRLVGALQTRLPLFELDRMHECEKAYTAAINAVRSNDTATSERLLQTAWTAFDSPSLSREVKLLCKTFTCAASAYVHYKRDSFIEAINLLLAAIECDDELERRGYEMLHAHRLHLIENILKSEIRAKNIKRAFEISGQLLSYLGGARSGLDFPGTWGPASIDKTPPLVIRTTFAQVTNTIADSFFACQNNGIATFFDMAAQCLNMQMQRKHVDFRALTWLRAKRRFLRGDFQGFLALCPLLISDGPSNTESLWFDVLFDLMSVLGEKGEQGMDLSREIAQWIANCGFGPRGMGERRPK